MVRWDVFRPSGGTGGAAVYDYGSDQPTLLKRVAGGGTLWLVTSRLTDTAGGEEATPRHGRRRYSLAYKLVSCVEVDRQQSLFSGRWKHVVRARDWERSRHFRYNDATDTLRRLQFTSGKPMSQVKNMGLRLRGIPELTADDVELLERLQHKIESGRAVFISYSRSDSDAAAAIESELGRRDIGTSRDVAFLQPGQEWEAALRQEVTGTDCFLVLVSRAAAESPWVKREVQWALGEYAARGLVKAVAPVVLDDGGWESFPELHRFERWPYRHQEATPGDLDRLAAGIVAARARLPADPSSSRLA